MSNEAEEFNPEERRKKWLERLVREIDKVEALMPVKILPEGVDYPAWVLKVEREFSLVMLPAAKLQAPDFKVTPKRMGAVMGHMCEMAVWMMEWIEYQFEGGGQTEVDAAPAKTPTEAELEKGLETMESLEKWYHGMQRLAKLALCSSVDQPYEDMTGFLLGFADGFSRKPKTFKPSNMGNPTFEIYVFMLIFWQLIVRLDSVRQLHEILVKEIGANRVGDQKRVEKICQRIGLSFRKPGRPKK